MNVGPFCVAFPIVRPGNNQKTKAGLFSCFVAGRAGQSSRADAIRAVCFAPSRLWSGAVCKEGLDEK